MSFLGFVALEGTLTGLVVTKTTGNVPTEPTGSPTYRVYGSTGTLMTSGSGTLSQKDTGVITGATNASPIVITSAAHGLQTGARVTVASVGGNTAANGTFQVTRVSADTFSLDGSTGNSAYTSGGTWHVTGLYGLSLSVTANNGYESGKTYTIIVEMVVSGSTLAQEFTFTVT